MRNTLIASLVAATAAALALATTATGASTAGAAPAAIPGCAVGSLNLVEDGVLTIGTDNPAFPPWFGGAEKTKPWKVSDPYSGKGYESAVAYAVAKQLGFAKAQVKWTVVPFNNSFAPGKKPFDFYITQVSYTPERAKAVDFSTSYYYVNQAVVGRKGTPIAKVEVDRRPASRSSSARQVGTTSYDVHHRSTSSRRRSRSSTTRTTPRCRRSRTARSTGSSSTCRPPSTSPPSRSRRRRDRRPAADQRDAGALRDGASRRATR